MSSSDPGSKQGAPPVLLERDGNVAHLVLNRPGKLNAIDGRTLEALQDALHVIERDPETRVVVVRGAGRVFCAGADLGYVEEHLHSAEAFGDFLEHWHDAFLLLERCSRPTIAAVHGLALAGGLELTQACDLVVAAEDAEFGDQHAKFGLFPGGGSTQRLPRLVGRRAALWLLLSGDRFSAATAADLGMVNRVVPSESLRAEVDAMADQLVSCSAGANRAIKRAVREGSELPLEEGLALERSIAVMHMLGRDAQIGLAAFHARQVPVFSGTVRGREATDGVA